MKKIKLAISGCMGRMGQQLIKSSYGHKDFKLVSLTENFIVNKKKMIQLAETGYTTATDLADHIVREYNYPFRKAYLITSKMEIIPTGLKFPDISGEWLLDGEYITKNKIGEELDINLYMIFDIYHNGNSKGTKPIQW